MDESQSQKSRFDLDVNHDYISNLPTDVKQKILVKLPIQEMVRTSVLSSRWFNVWISVPTLAFDDENDTELELIELVDTVLIMHQGPIQTFKLVSYHDCSEAIGRWLLFLTRKCIKDLELICGDGKTHLNIPFRLISCILLERLSLAGCDINVPSYFEGFKLVRTLILSDFYLNGISIENMVSHCPLLDHLELSNFGQYSTCLRILAPKLTFLKIHGKFHDIILETPKLASGCIHLVSSIDYQKIRVSGDTKDCNIVRALGRLSNIQKLDICGKFGDYLAVGPVQENLPTVFSHLTNIGLHLYINPNGIAVALCLFENAPNLEILRMQFTALRINQPNVEAAWELKAIKDCLFKRLKVVDISITDRQFTDPGLLLESTKSMLQFAKLVLSTAPVLEKLNFVGLQNVMVIFEMLKWFPKLSMTAQINFVRRSTDAQWSNE